MSAGAMDRALLWCLGGYALFLPITISISQPLALVAALLWLWLFLREQRRPARPSPLRWPIVLLTIMACASWYWSIRPDLTHAKLDRFLLFAVVFAAPMALEGERTAEERAWRLAWLFIAGATLQALADVVSIPVHYLQATRAYDAMLQAGELPPRMRRPTLFDMGNMRDPQMYTVSLCLLIGWFLYRSPGVRARWWWPAAALNATAFILHFKRGAWLSFLISAGFMALLSGRRRLVMALLLAALGALAMPQVRDRLNMLQDEFLLKSGGRYALWTKVMPELTARHPWGMGWKATRHEDFRGHGVRIQPKLNHLHNNALQMRLELGYAGLLAWAAMTGMALVIMARTYATYRNGGTGWAGLSFGVFGGYLALQLNGLVEYNFGDAEIFMLMNLLLALATVAWLHRPIGRQAGRPATPAPDHGH